MKTEEDRIRTILDDATIDYCQKLWIADWLSARLNVPWAKCKRMASDLHDEIAGTPELFHPL